LFFWVIYSEDRAVVLSFGCIGRGLMVVTMGA